MELSEDARHTLLLAITAIIFIIFATGRAVPGSVPVQPVIVA